MNTVRFLTATSIMLLALTLWVYPWEWTAVMIGAGLAYGSLSPVLHSRRLLFMAGSAPHAVLAATALGAILSSVTGAGLSASSILIGTLLVYTAGYMVYRGMDPDVSASLLAGYTASLSVIGLYLASSMGAISVSGVIIGDPLLASRVEALAVLLLGITLFILVTATSSISSYIGVDRDDAILSGSMVWLYDLTLYTILALSTVALIRVIGFVLEHVLLLIPGSLILPVVRGSREATLAGGLLGLSTGLAGLYIGGLAGLPPAAVSGLVLMAAYVYVMYTYGVWRSG